MLCGGKCLDIVLDWEEYDGSTQSLCRERRQRPVVVGLYPVHPVTYRARPATAVTLSRQDIRKLPGARGGV